MAPWPPADDDALLGELGEALAERAVDDEHLDAARAAFAWRRAEAEVVAELIFDSACDLEPAGAVRSAGAVRTLTFRGGDLRIEIEVSGDGIVGQLAPASGGRVTAGTVEGVFDEAPVGPVGLFSLSPPPPGPIRICAHTPGCTVVTSWVRLA